MQEMEELGGALANSGHFDDLEMIITENLGTGMKASELKKGQEQQIEAIIYDIQSFIANNNIEV